VDEVFALLPHLRYLWREPIEYAEFNVTDASLTVETPAQANEVVSSDLKSRAKAVAAIAAKFAPAVDTGSRFPAEAFDAIRAHKLLGIMVPVALGGEGAGIAEAADVCFQLGRACASTGMIYAMHQIKVACIVRHMHGSAAIERVLRKLCAEQLLMASSTTEGQGGGNVRSSEAPIEYQGGNISLVRAASVISYGANADGVVTTARRNAEAAASDQVLVVFLKGDYTLTRLQGWNTLGMRGTCSEGYTLKASGSADQIVPEPYEIIHPQTMVPFAHLLWGSVWAGIAASATARAQSFIRHVMRQGSGQMPPGAAHYTRALTSLRTLRSMLATALHTFERNKGDSKALASLEFQTMITMTKVEASELAASVVLSALRACGLSGYRCDGEFSIERNLRDILSAPIMIHNDRILANLAASSLMTAIPASLSD
jgi:acyl-CoA dehydrogenase